MTPAELLTETVTVIRPLDPRIADLVRFGQEILSLKDCQFLSNAGLIERAHVFWQRQHGDDE